MNPTTLAATVRRFPLLGRPRPSCPSLPERVQEIVDIARAAGHDDADGLADGASVLNKAALIASDCGLPDLARDLCWQHIDLYRVADRSLTVLQARHMLEPVLNLARLQLRASDGDQALRLLKAMFQAVKTSTDLVVDGRTLPLTDLAGTRTELHKLREWVWLHLIGEGVRALALARRWDDAVAHAHAHRGIGLHLMDGRQATIVAHCVNADLTAARAALAESTPEQPWELQVASCLKVMCANTDSTSRRGDVAAMITRFVERQPMPGYAFFRAQLGLTVTTLADTVDFRRGQPGARPGGRRGDRVGRRLRRQGSTAVPRHTRRGDWWAARSAHRPNERLWSGDRNTAGTSSAEPARRNPRRSPGAEHVTAATQATGHARMIGPPTAPGSRSSTKSATPATGSASPPTRR